MTFSATSWSRLSLVHPELQRRVRQLDALLPDLDIQVTQGLRTWAAQDALYAQGRTAPGKIVTDVLGGHSAHNFGYAVDLVPEDIAPGQPDWNASHPAWKQMLAAGPSAGLAEGATWRTFPDAPHFYPQELPAEPTDEMRALYAEGGLQKVWDSFKLDVVASPAEDTTT